MPIAEDPEHPSDGPQDDPFDGLVLDEDFVRAATVKEQSGRARMLAAKWQREPPEPVPHRADAQVVKLSGRRRARALRRIGAGLGRSRQTALIVLCVCGLALLGLQLGGKAEAPQRPVVRPTGTASPTTSLTPSPTASPATTAGTPAPDSPWPVSPALAWPSGRTK
ncbi:hypothetical protein [Kitasatospora sp. MAP5-34]|uniref:SCO2583/SCO2584 N-terminal domain-containing protein n=1 Tax=Kitasatospora sp. MAP5-34 TaxID=3035102 RepID=UPI0024741673|nr:hypothetical protein [Kitasatospora sp. MAP5-34]MDH6576763.1 hypothetical protein [Kitasatospora sp. MAP5-34]